jgi:hypothetical protein
MTENQPGRGRRWAGWIVTALAVLTLALSVPVLWLHQTLLTTDGYVRVVEDLPADPELSAAVGEATAQRLIDRLNLGDRLREALPDAIDPLITTVVIGIEDRLGERIAGVVASPNFQAAWTTANEALHRQLLELLRGDPGVVELQGSQVTLDLTAIIAGAFQTLQDVGLLPTDVPLLQNADGSLAQTAVDALRARGWDIPPDLTAVPLFEAPNLGLAQTLVGAADAIALLLPLIGAVLVLLAIWLGRRTPRTLVIGAGALLVAAGLTLIVVNAAGDALTGAAATPAGEVILGSVMAALTDSLWRWVLVVSLIAAGLVLLASVFARRAAAEALEVPVTSTSTSTSTPAAPSPPGSASQPAV